MATDLTGWAVLTRSSSHLSDFSDAIVVDKPSDKGEDEMHELCTHASERPATSVSRGVALPSPKDVTLPVDQVVHSNAAKPDNKAVNFSAPVARYGPNSSVHARLDEFNRQNGKLHQLNVQGRPEWLSRSDPGTEPEAVRCPSAFNPEDEILVRSPKGRRIAIKVRTSDYVKDVSNKFTQEIGHENLEHECMPKDG